MTWPIYGHSLKQSSVLSGPVCLRLKTDQIGEAEDIIDFSGPWSADGRPVRIIQTSSGAEGTWVKFAYQLISTDPQVWQQFIIVKDWLGPWDGGDVTGSGLFYYFIPEGPGSAVPMNIELADSEDLNLQIQVDCQSGNCPPTFCPTDLGSVPGTTPGTIPGTIPSTTPPPPPESTPSIAGCIPPIGNTRIIDPFATWRSTSFRYYPSSHIFTDSYHPWSESDISAYAAYRVDSGGAPAALSELVGTGISIDLGYEPAPIIDVVRTDDTNTSGAELILVRFTSVPARLLPGVAIVNPATGKTVTLRNPLETIRQYTMIDPDLQDILYAREPCPPGWIPG